MVEYRFAQVNTSVSTKFVTLMDLCSKNLMRKEEVLHLFAVSRIEKVEASENSGYEVPPLQELKKEGEWSSSFAYRKEKIIELMESFSTLQFLKEYEAHYRKNQNFIGLEQNIIYERFIKQAKPGKKLHIVDPSPYLVEAIIKDTRIVPSNVAFVFSNMALCTIYSRTDSMKGYSLFHIEDYSKYKDNYKGTCVDILYFSHEKDQSRIEMEIEAISEYLSEAASLSFFGMIPSVMLDNKKKLQSLSKWLMTMFHLKMITQFDQKAIKSSGYIKWSIAVFSTRRNIPVSPHKPWQGEEVYLQRCMLKGQETTGSGLTGASYKVIILEDLLSKKVPCEELFDNESSIYKIYSALFASGQKRDQSYKYKIAEEIGQCH